MASTYQAYPTPRSREHHDASIHPYPPNSGPYNPEPIITPPYDPKTVGRTPAVIRTPSPTPSEERELKSGVLDWKTLSNWRFWIRREWLWYYVALVVILVVTALVTIFHKQIVDWLTPVTKWLFNLKFGWLVPIGVLFVISFPPLFGHEIVAILCGLVWGLWIGFAIVSAGTFLGEVGNFYAFKYCCRSRGEKLERTKLTYACLAKVVRDGGFKIALIARLSAIPGHFTTAVFSTCGMGIIVFSIAAILSLPKQFITVYLGVILEQSDTGVTDKKSKIISDVVLAITFIITVLAMWYIFHQMNKVKPQVIYERRKARQRKLERAELSPYHTAFSSESTVAFDPYSSDDIPLNAQTSPSHHALNPGHLYAPQPQRGQPELGRYSRDTDMYGDGYHPRASTDDVDWDMRPVEHARPEDMYGYGHLSQATPLASGRPHGAAPSSAPSASSSQYSLSHTSDPGMTQTPTQAQFVTWNPPASHSDDSPGLLPTPKFYPPHNDSAAHPRDGLDSTYYGHGPEASDATYRTALSREPSEIETSHPPRRALSPPPPSYRTNVR